MLEEFLLYYGEWLLFGTIILGFVFLLLRQHLHNQAPEYVAAATVVSRRLGTARYHGKYSSSWNHLVTFQLGDSSTIELYTGEAEYIELKEGLRGTLRWHHDEFLEFITDD